MPEHPHQEENMPSPIHATMRYDQHRPQLTSGERGFLEEAARRALAEKRRVERQHRAAPGRSVRAFLARTADARVRPAQRE